MKITHEYKLEVTIDDEHLGPNQRKLIEEATAPLAIKRLLLSALENFEVVDFPYDSEVIKLRVTKTS